MIDKLNFNSRVRGTDNNDIRNQDNYVPAVLATSTSEVVKQQKLGQLLQVQSNCNSNTRSATETALAAAAAAAVAAPAAAAAAAALAAAAAVAAAVAGTRAYLRWFSLPVAEQLSCAYLLSADQSNLGNSTHIRKSSTSVSRSGPYRPPGGVEEMQGGGRRVRLEWGAYITV
ncbi:hypothetical protein FHG87_011424 [Trinorchestia longiramus]|nr:hypothetical protein FHG87_011424 [Trinorchestia longiramus]